MEKHISRRDLINHVLLAAAAVTSARIGTAHGAAALTPIDPNDPAAKSLGYAADTSKVDAAANPTHKPEQACSNCAQYLGKPGEAEGGCSIFPGKNVSAKGWCKVYAKKPG